jgi:hypothetical protein
MGNRTTFGEHQNRTQKRKTSFRRAGKQNPKTKNLVPNLENSKRTQNRWKGTNRIEETEDEGGAEIINSSHHHQKGNILEVKIWI